MRLGDTLDIVAGVDAVVTYSNPLYWTSFCLSRLLGLHLIPLTEKFKTCSEVRYQSSSLILTPQANDCQSPKDCIS